MDRLSELSERTLAALIQNYIVIIGLLVLTLIFAIYVYITPNAETFTGVISIKPTSQENTRKHQ